MLDTLTRFSRQVRSPALAAAVFSALVMQSLTLPSLARGERETTLHTLDAMAQAYRFMSS